MENKLPKEKILVFIPMYNCESQIPNVLKRFGTDKSELFRQILIVDNRSKDNSLEAAKQAADTLNLGIHIKIVRNLDNYNLGGSHKVAFNYAIDNSFDYIVVLHGDDQGDVKDIIEPIKMVNTVQLIAYLELVFLKDQSLLTTQQSESGEILHLIL